MRACTRGVPVDFQRRCQNLTPMETACLPMEDRHGRAVLLTVAKLTFAVSATGEWTVLERGAPIRRADVPVSDEPYASIHYPSDYVDEKPGTDVIFIGTAYPSASSPNATEQDVSVRVGLLHKTIRVYGPRVYQASGITSVTPGPARPLAPTPLRYELAWGGRDETDPHRIEVHQPNPAGRGFAESRQRLVDAPAHQLELSSTLLEANTEPAGFGPIAGSWQPRLSYAGTYDAAWRRERAPIAPADFDPRFHCCAHPDLYSPTPLDGTEPVEVLGATPEGIWRFQLPHYQPRFISTRQGLETEHATHLDTFLIDGDERRVEPTWRVSVPLPRKATEFRSPAAAIGDR